MRRAAGVAIATVLAALAQQPSSAQDLVQRCGSSYSYEPCATGGSGVDVADPRSAQQVAQARQVAQRDARLADQLARQRRQSELAAARQGPATIGGVAAGQAPLKCRTGSDCARTRHVKRTLDKAERVTLYRAKLQLRLQPRSDRALRLRSSHEPRR